MYCLTNLNEINCRYAIIQVTLRLYLYTQYHIISKTGLRLPLNNTSTPKFANKASEICWKTEEYFAELKQLLDEVKAKYPIGPLVLSYMTHLELMEKLVTWMLTFTLRSKGRKYRSGHRSSAQEPHLATLDPSSGHIKHLRHFSIKLRQISYRYSSQYSKHNFELFLHEKLLNWEVEYWASCHACRIMLRRSFKSESGAVYFSY